MRRDQKTKRMRTSRTSANGLDLIQTMSLTRMSLVYFKSWFLRLFAKKSATSRTLRSKSLKVSTSHSRKRSLFSINRWWSLAWFIIFSAWPNVVVFYNLHFGLPVELCNSLLLYAGAAATGPLTVYLFSGVRPTQDSNEGKVI